MSSSSNLSVVSCSSFTFLSWYSSSFSSFSRSDTSASSRSFVMLAVDRSSCRSHVVSESYMEWSGCVEGEKRCRMRA